ncbi:glycosyltransferase family 2 protein [Flavobacterium selenitireducens]|uniref:glycosyltransferase family 2 protein n=1 Tax=Flavobacterium selenitireducens TaxID=2722704 RepID=UPI00168AE74C|nr:glycosyltransferase [Flavobacterium selenitireducens]MBD3583436.1 glycosyltransferase [Flavobacterium selenitireducens]
MFEIHISTRNRRDDLLFTLGSIRESLSDDVVVRVYDDGSTDGTSEAVSAAFPEVILLRNQASKGYMFCRNHMLNTAKAEFAISLDDDAHFVSENPLDGIKSYFGDNPQCALVGFRIFWGKELPENLTDREAARQVKSYVGCGHAWRISAWRQIPDYPEFFGFYGEENYASMQLFRKGFEVHYLPSVLVQHRVDLVERRTQPDYGRRLRFSLRSDWASYFVFLPWTNLAKMIAYTNWMQLKLKVFKGDATALKAVVRANLDILGWLPKLLSNDSKFTRKQYEAYRKLPEAAIYWKPENK